MLNACGRGDAVAAERALRGWLRAAGVSVPVVNWAEGTGDAALVAAVNALQERLYRGRSDEAWDGAALAAALRKLGPLRARPPRSPAAPLPDLYPASSVSS